MRPDHPHPALIPGLRKLWQEAFGDTEEYLDGFFRLAYSPENCLCIGEGDIVHAALYWLDMTCRGERIAYIYAVATAKNRRGEGCAAPSWMQPMSFLPKGAMRSRCWCRKMKASPGCTASWGTPPAAASPK